MRIDSEHDYKLRQKLIENLLYIENFDNEDRRLLSLYPSRTFYHKGRVIAELLNKLWGKPKLFEPYNEFDLVLGLGDTRGHFIHQFEVFLLGLNIIQSAKDQVLPLCKALGLKDYREVISTWITTATAHDFGYPMQYANKIADTLKRLYSDIDLTYISDQYKDLAIKNPFDLTPRGWSRFLPRLKPTNYVEDFIHDGINSAVDIDCTELIKYMRSTCSHGYASAYITCKRKLDDIRTLHEQIEFRNSQEAISLQLAAGAIALHSIDYLKDEYSKYMSKLCPEKNIFAYILFFVDNLQDWDRTLFDGNGHADFKLHKFDIVNRDIKISYLITHRAWTDKIKKEVTEFVASKERIFNFAIRPILNIRVIINFETNDGSTLYKERVVTL